MKKTLSMLLAGAMLATALTGCGGSASGSSDSQNSGSDSTASGTAFKIGGTGPLTGAAAIYGNACKNGAQIAVDEINAEGGDIQFELNYQDDEHDAEKAVNAYNTLKDWGMQLSLGSVTSKPCEATAAENYSDRIFALTPSASTVAVTADKDNVFQMCFVDPNQGTASAQYIAEQKLGTKIAVIWKNDDVYSTGIHDKFCLLYTSRGQDGHCADGCVAAVLLQRYVEGDGEQTLRRLHDKRGRAQTDCGCQNRSVDAEIRAF